MQRVMAGVLGCLVMSLVMTSAVARAASEDDRGLDGGGMPLTELTVWMGTSDRSVTASLAPVRDLVSRLFARAGVHVNWLSGAMPPTQGALLVLFSRSHDAPQPPKAVDVLGVAHPGSNGSPGVFARVFSDRAVAFADEHRLDLTSVLAGIVVHELGHLLLPGNAHSYVGIMQPVWHPQLFPPNASSVPGFAAWQAKELRSVLATAELTLARAH